MEMTDEWHEAAARIRAQSAVEQAAKQAAKQAAASADAAALAAKKQSDQAAQLELQRAIADATQSLADFVSQRGAAARELLAARGNQACVIFGEDRDGGYYTSVYLYEGGLAKESGFNGTSALYGGQNQEPPSTHKATPRDAVLSFAYHGQGHKNPETVRGIVTWLTQQVDAIARR